MGEGYGGFSSDLINLFDLVLALSYFLDYNFLVVIIVALFHYGFLVAKTF
jgi:hypothetical protein